MKELPPRPRLESTLDAALAHRLTVLVADAGFGKTTLLSAWSAGIHAVGYPVSHRDQELTTFWRHLVAALRRHLGDLPELGAAIIEAARGPGSAQGELVRAQAMAELLGQVLEQRLTRDLVLVLDDAHLVNDGPSASLVAGLVRHAPPLLHVVLSSRVPPSIATARLQAQGQVLGVSGAELAFTTGEVAELLATLVPDAARNTNGLAEQIRAATGGWPIAVRLTVEALREVAPDDRAERVAQLADTDGQLTELVYTIYRQEPPATQRLLAIGALFGRFTVGLCQALGVADAADQVASLGERGLFIEPATSVAPVSAGSGYGTGSPAGPGQWYRLHPLARRFITGYVPLPPAEVAGLHARAARWFVTQGRGDLALRSLADIADYDQLVALLTETGERLAIGGHADRVVEAVAALPAARRSPAIELLAGNAYLVRGDWAEALSRYTRAAAGGGERQPPGLAWRIGLIHYLRGDQDQALAAYQRGDTSGEPDRDTAMLLAWAASAHWIRGDAKTCGELVTRALRIATAADDPAALAAAHTVLSMLAALEGDRRANAAHYGKALEYAERAGDVLQLIRIHANRASHHLEEGTYSQAMADLEVAIRLADLSSYGAFGALALHNRAEIRVRLGQLEEAHRDIEAALALFDDLGSRKAAYPLRLLGHLSYLRGDRAAARRAYEQALAHVDSSGDLQATVPTLAGLARLLADEDIARAESLVEQALAYGEGLGHVEALLAAARVAAARGDPDLARQRAVAARVAAQARRDRAGVAEAWEIEATVAEEVAEARALAGRAAALWAELGDPIGRAAAELAYADRLDDAAARAGAEAVRRTMEEIGCRLIADAAAAVAARHHAGQGQLAGPGQLAGRRRPQAVAGSRPAPSSVRVETLGAFRLVRGGVVAPAAAWKSRKAREILKILLARRGRPVTRELLVETLWPDQPPDAAAALTNRLHVAVSTLRAVLDPDRHFDSDTFVVTDEDAVRVRLEHLEVDVESFLDDTEGGLTLLRAGRRSEGLSQLARAESRYAGEFLEEDLYADWATPLREQARAAYLSVAARLAENAEASGDVDAATRYLLRILEHDPYDERAHLRLVSTFAATGRHGDARRHYRHYCARMEELEVEAAPFPVRRS